MSPCRVLLLPGWLDSDAGHWQSHWERTHGYTRVLQSDWLWPKRGDWMARLEEVLLAGDEPAWLVAPPDVERNDMPPNLRPWRPVVRRPLPFASIALTSDDDPFGEAEPTRRLVREWGARQVSIGNAGHVNAASELGDWPAGHALLSELMAGGAGR